MSATTSAIQTARTLADGGWSYSAIARFLTENGLQVHKGTVRLWLLSDEERSARLLQQRRTMAETNARRSGGRLPPNRPLTPERIQARIEGLHRVGLSTTDIARVLDFDRVEPGCTVYSVRRRLGMSA